MPNLESILTADEIACKVEDLAQRLAPNLDDETVLICLLIGGLWFAADLSRALAKAGRTLAFDALWFSSYRDEEVSSGQCQVRAGLQRSVTSKRVLLVDDVIDSGLSLACAVDHVRAAGASAVTTAVFARKPWRSPRTVEPDFFAYDAPARFLVGYGMDSAGCLRGLPGLAAMVA